ncbi:MAG: DUF2059 domain-containing protein [Deltaproteobacteria bacterium]|nr:DUF2059 domain-containing protein [Deltaproteobacteria bacterium]
MTKLVLALALALSHATDIDAARKLIALDGAEQDLKNMRSQIVAGLYPVKPKIAPDAFAILKLAVETEFDEAKLFPRYEEVFLSSLSDDTIRECLKWYESPIGKKLSKLQAENTTGEKMAELRAFAAAIEKKPPARARLLKELDEAMRGSALFLDLDVNMSWGIMVGLMAFEPGGSSPERVAQARKRLADFRTKAAPEIRKKTFATYAFVYREATDDEIRKLIAFAKTPAGKKLIEASFLALNDTLQHASQDVGVDVGASYKPPEPKKKK